MRGTIVGAGLLVTALVVGVVLVTTGAANSTGVAAAGSEAAEPSQASAVPDAPTATGPSGVAVAEPAVTSDVAAAPNQVDVDGLGPVEAALAAVALTGDFFAEPGIISRSEMVTAIATDAFGPVLKDSVNAGVSAYAIDTRTAGLAVVESPITVAALERGDGRWDVSVWSVLVMAAPGEDVARSLWRTSTFTMANVDGVWLIDGLGIESGPQPAPFAAAAFSDPDEFGPVMAWTDVASVGG